ncbi:multiple coagulation factor deficiency protein 2 homolog [Stegodyphus dumicola]|uniref:multiple coagulation factor deficiency protein 2 homolog n=1 Tax=Stegodyphus dumicola TaxID=202533 RepID=UPI0015B288BD|nr:multiple coagulation factor deficiency protein 2 homolog [Stegodyphus dumicola]
MHDFDDNGKLDGLELVAAMTHAMEHSDDHNLPFQEKEAIVDSFFSYDDNMDGFISYPELRRHLAPSEERKP